MVHLYYWNGKQNAGDYFSYWLIKKLYKNVDYSENPNLVATGSILGHKNLSNNTIVWGSGWHNSKWSKTCPITNKENFKAVRGKLTADFLQLGESVALGDPGLLASKYFNSSNIKKKRKILIVCHWQDYDSLYAKYHNKYSILNMGTTNVEEVLTTICESELVLSSSLHGIIFAHSFGIPAVHIEHNDIGSIDNFKFKDYYSVLDTEYVKYSADNEAAFLDIYNNRHNYVPSAACIERIQANLLKALPAEESLPEESVCICAIAKNENHYIREWVEHHKALGFNKIFLYDNNDIDGETFDQVINDYIKSGFVEIINIRGLSNQQIKCYNDFYHSKEALQYKWVAYFDIDEFLFLDSYNTVQAWLHADKYTRFDAIAVNWKYFDDNNLVEVKDNNYSIKRFTHEFQEIDWAWAQHRFSKRFIRTGLELVVNSSHGPIAKAQMNEYDTVIKNKLKVCNIAGEPLVSNTLAFSSWTHKGGYLAHYRFKTIEEYVTCKMKRGYPTLYKNSGKDMNFADFFKLNTITDEKLLKIADVTGLPLNAIKESCGIVEKIAAAPVKLAEAKKEKNIDKPKKADGINGYYLYF